MFCFNCGKQIPDGSAFCPECGTKLTAPVTQAAPTAPVTQAAPTAPASYAAAPVKTKKGMSKGALIGIIAAAVAVIAAAVILILMLGSPKHKLVGTWTTEDESFKITFKSNGKGSFDEGGDSADFKWSIGKNKKLVIDFEDDDKETYKYDKDAKDGDEECWYLDGKKLYLFGDKLTKDSGKKDSDKEESVPADKLKGTWMYSDDDVTLSFVFRSGGKGEMKISYVDYDGEKHNDSVDYQWSVDGENNLTLINQDGDEQTFAYDKEAKDGDEEYWYIEGETLYFSRQEFTKK